MSSTMTINDYKILEDVINSPLFKSLLIWPIDRFMAFHLAKKYINIISESTPSLSLFSISPSGIYDIYNMSYSRILIVSGKRNIHPTEIFTLSMIFYS